MNNLNRFSLLSKHVYELFFQSSKRPQGYKVFKTGKSQCSFLSRKPGQGEGRVEWDTQRAGAVTWDLGQDSNPSWFCHGRNLWVVRTNRMSWSCSFRYIIGKRKPESSFEHPRRHNVCLLSGWALTKHPLFSQLLSASCCCGHAWLCTSFMSECSTPEPGLQFPSRFRIRNSRTHILFFHCLPPAFSLTASCIFLWILSLFKG